ncbi:hypothetical protein [Coraliomargarita parva]|uniref:hypothetical protein n=1 Tax=Coraliomargarita parva TaxID=3014050 RepID=UPI0022B42C39|nr:hypothetical protein [Coraliomargarita parva]
MLIACLCSEAMLPAQSVEPDGIDTAFRFYMVGVADGARSQGYLEDNGPNSALEFYIQSENESPEPIQVKPGETSDLLRYQGSREFAIYRSIGLDHLGQPILKVLSTVSLPQGWQGGMLAILSGRQGVRLFPVERQLNPATKNTALIVNVSPLPVMCQAMDEMLGIGAYQSKSVSLGAVESDLQLKLKCAIRPESEWRVVYSGSQTVLKDQYYVFLLVPNGRNYSYSLVRFRGE